MRILAGAALLAALGGMSAAVATAQEPGCTEIGCSSGVFVTDAGIRKAAPRARTVTLCVDDLCRKLRVSRDGYEVAGKSIRGGKGPVRVRLVVRDRRGRVLLRDERRVRLARFRPNGAGCPPTCWHATLRYDADAGRLVTR